MRICIDIDGTICYSRKPEESYEHVIPIPGAVAAISMLRRQGHYVILNTARHMKTCDGNIGKIIALQGEILLIWLKRYEIEYDELWFGKPWADIYIDDKALKFEGSWQDIDKKILQQSWEEKE